MPWRPRKRCPYPNCQVKIEAHERYCQRHMKLKREEYDKYRPNAAQRGYNSHWQQVRIRYLNRHSLCIDCLEADRTEPATMVHHLLPLRRGGKHVSSNLVALCISCHAKREGVLRRKERTPLRVDGDGVAHGQ